MIFKQFRFEKLGQASYLVGCVARRKPSSWTRLRISASTTTCIEAADRGLAVTHVLETHVHADFISCARELAEAIGCRALPVPHGPVKYRSLRSRTARLLKLGQVHVQVLATPGHTPEHASFLVTDRARGAEPWFVLTGDSLFVGDVGRPDLLIGDQALDVLDEAERARLQYQSIKTRLFTLPEHVEVYPGHYGGSACGGINMSGKVSSTIYFEKRFNQAMQQPDAETFARFVKETAKPFPANYAGSSHVTWA